MRFNPEIEILGILSHVKAMEMEVTRTSDEGMNLPGDRRNEMMPDKDSQKYDMQC
jgi:hypothetical protein